MGGESSGCADRERVPGLTQIPVCYRSDVLTADYGCGEAKRACSCRWAGPPSGRIRDRGVSLSDAADWQPLSSVLPAAGPGGRQRGVPAGDEDVQGLCRVPRRSCSAMTLLGPDARLRCLGVVVMSVQLRSAGAARGSHGSRTSRPTHSSRWSAALVFEAARRPGPAREQPGDVHPGSSSRCSWSRTSLNFLLIAVDFAVFDGWPIWTSLRQIYVPVLPVEFATGLLTAGVALAYQDGNLAVIGLLARHRPRLPVPAEDRAELDGAQGRSSRGGPASSPRFRSGCSAPCCRRSRCATR